MTDAARHVQGSASAALQHMGRRFPQPRQAAPHPPAGSHMGLHPLSAAASVPRPGSHATSHQLINSHRAAQLHNERGSQMSQQGKVWLPLVGVPKSVRQYVSGAHNTQPYAPEDIYEPGYMAIAHRMRWQWYVAIRGKTQKLMPGA